MAYKNIIIPEGKDPKTYSYQERRSEILKLILEAGHPGFISQTQLAKRYDVSQAQISQDVDAIGKEIKADLGSDAELITTAVYNKVIKDLMKGDLDDKFKAAKLVSDLNNWFFDIGVKTKVADKLDVKTDFNMKEVLKKCVVRRKD